MDNSISYKVIGNSGPWILLCHGLLGDGQFWNPVLKFSKTKCRYIIPDLRGHGKSSTKLPFNLWDQADDLFEILKDLKIESVRAIGFSMGGMAVMRLAIKYPHLVSSLGLVCTGACQEPLKSKKRNLKLASIIKYTGPLKLFEPIGKDLMFDKAFLKSHSREVEEVMQVIRNQSGLSLYHAFNAVFTRDDLKEFIKGISIPTTIIAGEKDKSTPPSWSQEIHQLIKGSTLTVIPKTGHMAPIEKPEAVSNLLEL